MSDTYPQDGAAACHAITSECRSAESYVSTDAFEPLNLLDHAFAPAAKMLKLRSLSKSF